MKALKTILIEDEQHVRDHVRDILLQDFPKVIDLVAEADEVPEALRLIQTHEPDLVLLDIQIRKGTAFQLLDQLPLINFLVIFMTGHPDGADKAFDAPVVDFVVKPFLGDRLQKAVRRALEKRRSESVCWISNRYALRSLGLIEIIPHDHIVRLEGDGNCTHFFLKDGRRRTEARNLGSVANDFWQYFQFLRIHQSHLINGTHLESINTQEKEVRLSNGDRANVSKGYWADLKRWLDSF